jgi:CheY-like chemotaxis protein
MHGGTINVTSKVARGTTFTVTIPYGTSHLAADRIAAHTSSEAHSSGRTAMVEEALSWLPQDSRSSPLGQTLDAFDLGPDEDSALSKSNARHRVLLADDNRDMREYVRNLLSSRFEVVTAENGRVALESALNDPPDVVLSDVMMPEMDGFQLLAALRKHHRTRTVPVVLLSARAGEESRVEGMDAGADDYLIKPFTARELLARVEAHVKIAQFRREAFRREAELQRELQEARQLAADAVANISDGFFTLDGDWRFTYLNAAGERIMAAAGATAHILGQSLWKVLPDLFGSDIDTQYRRCMEQRVAVEFETFYARRWYAVRAYPTPQDGMTIYIADVSARKKAEETLRMKQEHLLLTQRSAKIGSWELDVEEEELTISPEFAEIAGLPLYVSRLRYSEFLNALFFSTDRNELTKSLDAALRGNKEFSIELRLKPPDGTVRLVASRGKAFYNQGTPIVLGVLIDITPLDFKVSARRGQEKRSRTAPRRKKSA